MIPRHAQQAVADESGPLVHLPKIEDSARVAIIYLSPSGRSAGEYVLLLTHQLCMSAPFLLCQTIIQSTTIRATARRVLGGCSALMGSVVSSSVVWTTVASAEALHGNTRPSTGSSR